MHSESEKTEICKHINNIYKRIKDAATRVGRDWQKIKLIGVTKTVSISTINIAIGCGLKTFGENRIQEAIPKIETLPSDTEWHFIGHLQRNKVKYLNGLFRLVHSLDSLELAYDIDRLYAKRGDRLKTLVQINLSRESTKHGVDESEVFSFLKEISKLEGVMVCGLMTIPKLSPHQEDSRHIYRQLRQIRDRIIDEGIDGITMDELSMGMSSDFEVAIEEGATIIRVGSAIFGERKY